MIPFKQFLTEGITPVDTYFCTDKVFSTLASGVVTFRGKQYRVRGIVEYDILTRFKNDMNLDKWWENVNANLSETESMWEFLELVDFEIRNVLRVSVQENVKKEDGSEDWQCALGTITDYKNIDETKITCNTNNFTKNEMVFLVSSAIPDLVKFLRHQSKNDSGYMNQISIGTARNLMDKHKEGEI